MRKPDMKIAQVQVYCTKCGASFVVVPYLLTGRGFETITCPRPGCEHQNRIADELPETNI